MSLYLLLSLIRYQVAKSGLYSPNVTRTWGFYNSESGSGLPVNSEANCQSFESLNHVVGASLKGNQKKKLIVKTALQSIPRHFSVSKVSHGVGLDLHRALDLLIHGM